MTHKYIKVNIIASIKIFKNSYKYIYVYIYNRFTIPFRRMYNLNIKFLIFNKLGPNVLNRVP